MSIGKKPIGLVRGRAITRASSSSSLGGGFRGRGGGLIGGIRGRGA